MFINWKNDRVKLIPLIAEARKDAVDKKSTLILLPGINDIEDKVWEVVKEYSSIKRDLKVESLIEVTVKKKTTNGLKITTEFKELSQIEAEKLVAKTVSIVTLKKWKKVDSRPDIRATIQDRIKEIKNYNSKENNMANQD